MSLVDTLNIVVLGISTLITIIMIFWFYTFYKIREVPQISARRPNTSLLVGFLCIIGTLFSHNFQIIFMNLSFIKYIPYTNLLTYLFVMVSSGGAYHVLTYRAFLVYFDIKWNKAMEDQKWRLYIDPEETNWFLKHRNSWGSPKRAKIIVFVNWICWFIIGTAAFIYNGPNTIYSFIARATIVIASVPVLITDIILYFKFPKFNDLYRIRDEILITIKYKVASVTLFYIIALAVDAPNYSLQYLFLAVLGVCVSFGFVIIIYFWVFVTFNLPKTPCTIHKYMNHGRALSIQLQMDKGRDLNHIDLKRVLSDGDGFNCFARHLTKEFCLENLIFFVETQQWLTSLLMKDDYKEFVDADILNEMNINKGNESKTHMHQITTSITNLITEAIPDINKLNAEEVLVPDGSSRKPGHIEMYDLLTIKFPENAPKSKIITSPEMTGTIIDVVSINNASKVIRNNINGNDEYPSNTEYLQCIGLFKKYITNSAYFCINVSSSSRARLYHQFGFYQYDSSRCDQEIIKTLKEVTKIDKQKLFHIFDDSRSQIYKLLTYAFTRFKTTNEYEKLNEKLCND